MPKGSKVLMADDDKMLLDMYKERLELAGYVVESGFNGEEILAKVHGFAPDIIMLDVMMPKMNGYETLASLKSDPATKNVPVVMLSALMRDFNREKAVEGGAEDYLIKSEAMPSDVITKIEQVLQKYGKSAAGSSMATTPAAVSTPAPSPAVQTPTPTPVQVDVKLPQTPAVAKVEPAVSSGLVEDKTTVPVSATSGAVLTGKAVETPVNVNNASVPALASSDNKSETLPASPSGAGLDKILAQTAQSTNKNSELFKTEDNKTEAEPNHAPDPFKENDAAATGPVAPTPVLPMNAPATKTVAIKRSNEWLPLIVIIVILLIMLAVSFYYFVILQK